MFKLSRLLIVYLIAIPLALILGYLVSSPDQFFTYATISMLLFFMALPLFLKWHHILMIFFWNSAFNAAFLPGQPDFWVVFAALSFGISMLDHIMFQKRFLRAPELTRPLLCLAAVVLGTALLRGGVGIRALGGAAYGGKKYLLILTSILGYFALTAKQIPIAKSRKMAGLFFASGMTNALSNLIYMSGPIFYSLYYIVPIDAGRQQAFGDLGLMNVTRLAGLGPTSMAGMCLLMTFYGVRGLFDWGKPWRLFFLFVVVGGGFFGGYRSAIVMMFIIFAIEFYLEGLLRTHFLPIIVGLIILGFAPILLFSNKMPSSVQRAISFLPVNVDSEILESAQGSTDWRLDMWAVVWKEVPKYLILGKGYSIDPNEMAMVNQAALNGAEVSPFEGSMIAGDYHNGPLSILIPFGIFGVMTFIWVLIAGYRVLSWNYRFGDARLRRINRILLAYYITYCIAFFLIFGAFSGQLFIFLGICGLSVSLNGGVKRKSTPKPKPLPVPETLAMEPG